MDSLEILEHIKNAPSFKGGDSRYQNSIDSATQYDADIEQIRKDLELLETLKSHTTLENENVDYNILFSNIDYKDCEKMSKEWGQVKDIAF